MCSIAGFYNHRGFYMEGRNYYQDILNNMNQKLKHRGPDDQGICLLPKAGLAHTRLSIIDLENGCQPMIKNIQGRNYYIVYNGEIYNTPMLRKELTNLGYTFNTTSDTEILLLSFIHYGPEFITKINGIFAFAIYDEENDTIYFYRDHFGVKPFYYAYAPDGSLVFASEIKGLFEYPGIEAVVDRKGLCEIFGLGPSKTPGQGVFKGVKEVKPGHYIKASLHGLKDITYFRLTSVPHTDSYEDTICRTRELIVNAITGQMLSDVPLCTFLSGGIDSSIVTSICASKQKAEESTLTTFSFDFENNSKYFKANSFQPSQDRPFVDMMKNYLNTNHRYLTCNTRQMTDLLYDSVISRDLPTMADVDSSLLFFCSQVAKENKVVLTGECADEVFGGYPWFYKHELLYADTFPWMRDITPRLSLLDSDFSDALNMSDYIANLYHSILSDVNILPEESREAGRRRQVGYLSIVMFMQTLLDRMDRTSMFSGLEARVPFADPELVQYVYNVPWEYKFRDNTEKSLLRQAAKGLVPDEILFRKKSPYPKSYNPEYEALLAGQLQEVINDSGSPVNIFLNKTQIENFLVSPKDYGKPWYGQLMAGPQMMAYILQINFWLKTYNITIEL